jgi:hypothetical protein
LFNQNNHKRIRGFSCAVVALIVAVLTSVSVAQKTPDDQVATEKTRRLVGRVLAEVSTLTFGAGLGPKYTSFIFGVEEDGSTHVVPVRISYAFFKSDGPPPDSFFDYSKRYDRTRDLFLRAPTPPSQINRNIAPILALADHPVQLYR